MGKAGGQKGSSRSTGPNEGQGAGERDGGTPEDVKFDQKKLNTNELNPGQVVGMLPADGEAPKGEVSLPVQAATAEALQRMAEKIETEALPAEYREQVLRYMELLRGRAAAGSGGDGSPPAGGAGEAEGK